MSTEREIAGKCLCGAVRFIARPKNFKVGVCHCDMCRRWSGGPFLALECGSEVEFENDDSLKFYRSSDWGERGFCAECGSALFWRTQDREQWVVSAGALVGPENLTLTSQIFIDEKPDYYDFANDTEKLTGAEVFAKFAGDTTKD